MSDEDAGEGLRAVEGDPRELTAVVVQKTRRETDPPSRRYVHEGGIVVRAVEIAELSRADQPVLDRPQCRRGSASDHQRPTVKVFLPHEILLCERVVPVGDQVDPALEEVIDRNPRDLLRLLPQGEQEIDLVFQKRFDAALVLEHRRDLHLRRGL